MQNKKLVLFDFDGVLVNTLEKNYEIHKKVNENLTWEKFQDFSNGNFFDGMNKAIEEGHHIIPENFYAHYEKNISSLNIHDILRKTVVALSQDFIICIVSSTTGGIIKSFINKENLHEHISEILGAELHQSKVVKIKMLLEKFHTDPQDAVFITDTLGDILEANECGVKSIGVLWGLHGAETLKKGNPAKIIDNPLLLLDSVKEILG